VVEADIIIVGLQDKFEAVDIPAREPAAKQARHTRLVGKNILEGEEPSAFSHQSSASDLRPGHIVAEIDVLSLAEEFDLPLPLLRERREKGISGQLLAISIQQKKKVPGASSSQF
jgi:hypothetical protein